MKQLFLILSLLISSFFCYAQLEKKTWLLGGNGTFYKYNGSYRSTNNNVDVKANEIKINASVGYFVIDKLALGLKPSFSYFRGTTFISGISTGDISSSTQLLIGPFARYYFLDKEKQINIFSEVSYSIGTNNFPTGNKEKGSSKEFSISTGLETFFNNNIGIEFQFGYKSKFEDLKSNSLSDYSNTKNGFNFSIGFQIHLIK